MWIKKVFIDGFKGFEKDFSLDLTPDKNIIIGKNGVGKTTILQAINLVLQQKGVIMFGNGSLSYANYINNAVLNDSLNKARTQLRNFSDEDLPKITIAVEFEPDDQLDPKYSDFYGNNYPNLMYENISEERYGICFEYKLDNFFESDFENYVESFISENIESNFEIPFEFYSATWTTFAGRNYSAAKDPLKSILIDNDAFTGNPYNMFAQTLYSTMGQIPQLHSRINFRNESKKVNFPLSGQNEENYQLLINPNSVDLERIVDVKDKQKDIYIRDLGSGEENLIKTKLSLNSKSNLIMIEEPENHLTAEKTREQLELIKLESKAKQLIITTHNPEIITTLDLRNSLWLSTTFNDQAFITKMKELPSDTIDFFNRRDDLDFLRIITAKRIIIVEGAAEYVLMRVFLRNAGYSEEQINSVEVISMVGRYYKPFNDLAGLVHNKLAVITDNDGEDKRINKIKEDNKKYSNVQIFTPDNLNIWTFEVAMFVKNCIYFMEDPDFKEADIGNSFNKTYTERLEDLVKRHATVGKKLSYMLKDKGRCTELLLRKNKNKKLEVPDYISKSFKWLFDED